MGFLKVTLMVTALCSAVDSQSIILDSSYSVNSGIGSVEFGAVLGTALLLGLIPSLLSPGSCPVCPEPEVNPSCPVCPVNACSFNPCQNGGVCSLNSLGIMQCSCPSGFGGVTCEIDCNQVQACSGGFQELPPSSGSCYYFCPTNSESFLSAQATCLALGATLWEPNSNEEFNAVTGAITGTDKYWTGAFDGVTEGSTKFIGSFWVYAVLQLAFLINKYI